MDPLSAALAIPPAIQSSIYLIEKIVSKTGQKNEVDTETLRELTAGIQLIKEKYSDFCRVTNDLRPWKHAHHCTNLIIHQECTVIFEWTPSETRQHFTNQPILIETELLKFEISGAFKNYIISKPTEEIELKLPEMLAEIAGGKSWYSFILHSYEELNQAHLARDPDKFKSVVFHLKNFTLALNHAADSQLLRGLERISDRLTQARKMLEPSD